MGWAVAVVLLVVAWKWMGRVRARHDERVNRAHEALEMEILLRVYDGRTATDIGNELANKPMVFGVSWPNHAVTAFAARAFDQYTRHRTQQFFRLDDGRVEELRVAVTAKLARLRERAANGVYEAEPEEQYLPDEYD